MKGAKRKAYQERNELHGLEFFGKFLLR